MVKKYILALFLICFSLQLNNASESSYFSLTPDATISVDVTTVCQYNDSPVITFTGSSGTAPYTFTYTDPDGVVQTITSTGNTATVEVPTDVDEILMYTLTQVQDAMDPMPAVISGQAVTITVTEGPNTTLGGPNPVIQDEVTVFRECNNATSILTFTNNSTTASTINTNYTIDWGDGSPVFNASTWSTADHEYDVGIYTLTYTITGNGTCDTTEEYRVFVGNTPSGSIVNPGNTNICNSDSITFPIVLTDGNPPGTVYTITFNDGSPNVILTHPPPTTYTHVFTTSSCGETGTFNNAFFVEMVASNPCDFNFSVAGPIYVSSQPTADFTAPTSTCVDSEICINNSATGSTNNGSNSDCDESPNILWEITPNTFTVTNGTLGDDAGSTDPDSWNSGSDQLCVTFSQPGTYTITQTAGNTCGGSAAVNTTTQTICVEAPLAPQFTLNTSNGCTPLDVNVTNTTDETTSCIPPTYQWQVSYTDDFCGTTPEVWSFTNGTSATSTSPSFNFITPGTYTIQLIGTNSCGNETNSQQVIVKQPPTVTIDPIGIICNTTSITPSAIISTCTDDPSSVTYDWQFPGATTTSSNLEVPGTIDYGTPGTYTFSLQVTNDCGISAMITETFTIEDVPMITNTDLTQDICSGTSTAAINLTASVTGTTFNWTGTATGGISGFTPSGTSNTIPAQVITTTSTTFGTVTYTVTPSIGNCDGTPVTFTITVNPAPEITTQPQSSTVCLNGTPNTLSIATSGASPQYQWYSNTTNSNIGGTVITGETNANYTPPTTTVGEIFYYCEIMFATGGCSTINSQVASVTVTPNASITSQPTPTQSLCVGSTITTPLTITFADGTGTASYEWFSNTTNSNTGGTAITGETNADYTPPIFTTTGNFYYYVELSFTGSSGCTAVVSDVAEIIVVETPMITTQPIATQTLCQNSTPQTLQIQASGGLGTFSYQWFSNTTNSNTGGTAITGETNDSFIPPTTTVGTLYYYCVVSQAASDSCSATSTTSEVTVNPAPLINSQPQSQEICIGDTITNLTVTFTNGVGTPTYQWYSNVVDDTTSGTAITGETTDTFTPTVTSIGTTYYYCIITFASGGCTEIISNTAEIIVNETPNVSNFTETICSGNSFTIEPDTSNGDIVPTNTTYTWATPTISPAGSITGANAETTPQTNISQTLTNTTALPSIITYTVTPTAGSCSGTPFTVEITVNPAISANVAITNIECFGANNGAITTNITGGVPFTTGTPYIISWTGPNSFTASTASISNLLPGDYTLTVQDEGGCPFSETYTIIEPTELMLTVDTENSISCFGLNDGELAVTITGGTPNYSYSWTRNGAPFSIDEDIANLTAATYELTVTDANNCGPIVQSFVITEPNELMAALVNQTNVECFGDTSGAIEINVSGGTPIETSPGIFDYTYAWTGPNGFTSTAQNLTNIEGGTYNLTVTDLNGCDDTLSVILIQPDEIVISTTFTEILCFGDNDASITITNITGGSGSYTIAWSNFGEGMSQTNLSAGDYTITVTDSNNCSASVTVTIPTPPIFTINPVVEQISCFGANDGRIILNFQGGQDPIDFAWTDDPNAGVERNNLGPGTYTINIVDAVPCTITETFIIIEPAALSLSSNITNALDCDDPNSGAINLLITGGSLPFTVNWSNGAITEDLDNIPPGDYVVTVIDANGCEISDTYTVVRPSPIVLDVATETNVNCNSFFVNQRFTAQVSGGVPPFTLNWSSGTVSGTNGEIMTTSQNGLVILEAIDALGCVSSFTFDVDIPVLSDADFTTTSTAFDTFGIYSQQDPIQFTNTTTGDFTNVSWNFGDGNFSNEENPLHTYASPGSYVVIQTVTFPGDCVYERVITLLIEKGYKLIMPTAFTPNDDGLNDLFRPVFIGLDNMQLDVYDTWGSLIYSETGDDIQGWDGKIKGEFVENGNYYYTFTAKTFFGKIVRESGPLTLIL